MSFSSLLKFERKKTTLQSFLTYTQILLKNKYNFKDAFDFFRILKNTDIW